MTTRRAKVFTTDPAVKAYLPHRYHVVEITEHATIIEGEDFCGWTLDGYVIPRLNSGWFHCEEIT